MMERRRRASDIPEASETAMQRLNGLLDHLRKLDSETAIISPNILREIGEELELLVTLISTQDKKLRECLMPLALVAHSTSVEIIKTEKADIERVTILDLSGYKLAIALSHRVTCSPNITVREIKREPE